MRKNEDRLRLLKRLCKSLPVLLLFSVGGLSACGDDPEKGPSKANAAVESEPDVREPDLGPCVPGIHVKKVEDLDALKGVRCIEGDLSFGTIEADFKKKRMKQALSLDSVDRLKDLERVSGRITFVDTVAPFVITFPKLRKTTAVHVCSKHGCMHNLEPLNFSFPKLRESSLEIKNPGTLEFPSLRRAEVIAIERGTGHYTFPALLTAGSIKINGQLSGISFPKLTRVREKVEVRQTFQNKGARFEAPELVSAGRLDVTSSPISCEDFKTFLPKLKSVTERFQLTLHPKVETCDAELNALETTGDFFLSVGTHNGVCAWNVSAPMLKMVNRFELAAGFNMFHAPQLKQVKAIRMNSGKIRTLDLPALESAETVQIRNINSMQKLILPKLKKVDSIELGPSHKAFLSGDAPSATPPLMMIGVEDVAKEVALRHASSLDVWPFPALKSANSISLEGNANLEPWAKDKLDLVAPTVKICGNKGGLPCDWVPAQAMSMRSATRPFMGTTMFRHSRGQPKPAEKKLIAFVKKMSRKYDVEVLRVDRQTPKNRILRLVMVVDKKTNRIKEIDAFGVKNAKRRTRSANREPPQALKRLFKYKPKVKFAKDAKWLAFTANMHVVIMGPRASRSASDLTYDVLMLTDTGFKTMPALKVGDLAKDRDLVRLGPQKVDLALEYRDETGSPIPNGARILRQKDEVIDSVLRVGLTPVSERHGMTQKLPLVVHLEGDKWVAVQSLATALPPGEKHSPSESAVRAWKFAQKNKKLPKFSQQLPKPRKRIGKCKSALAEPRCKPGTKRARERLRTESYCTDRDGKIHGTFIEWYPSTCAGSGRPGREASRQYGSKLRNIDSRGIAAVKSKTVFSHGVELGPRTNYDPDGKAVLRFSTNRDGQLHGWHHDFKIFRSKEEGTGIYFEGRKIGRWQFRNDEFSEYGYEPGEKFVPKKRVRR